MRRCLLSLFSLVIVFASCKKWVDEKAVDDPRLTRPYCNDPEAVNYNWDFPGKPDNSTCFYPTEVFNGNYKFTDSIFSLDFEYDTFFVYNISLQAKDKSKFTVAGFCPGSLLNFTADRYYKASADSIVLADSTLLKGQLACRITDTISGSIVRDPKIDNQLKINFTIYSDTGTALHMGTAIKQ